MITLFHVNYNCSFFILKKNNKYIFILNELSFFLSFLNYKKDTKINTCNNLILLRNSRFLQKLQINLKIKLNFFLKKIIFSGRGFKIEKKKKKMQFNFIKTFKTYLYLKKKKIFKFKKNKFLVLSKCFSFKEIENVFPWNKFTKKGLRFTQQIVVSVK